MDIEDELKDPARREFDNKVLQSIGAQDLYDKIKDSLLSLQHTRHCVKWKGAFIEETRKCIYDWFDRGENNW